jgi:hypothetical protein
LTSNFNFQAKLNLQRLELLEERKLDSDGMGAGEGGGSSKVWRIEDLKRSVEELIQEERNLRGEFEVSRLIS